MQSSLFLSRRSAWLVAVAAALSAVIAPASLLAAPTKPNGARPSHVPAVDPAIQVAARNLTRPPQPARTSRALPTTVPLTVEWAHPPTEADLAALERAGGAVQRDTLGRALGALGPKGGAIIAVEASASAARDLAKVQGVARVRVDAPLLPPPRPLDYTAELVGAKATWGMYTANGLPLRGAGITICDVDAGIDVLHPMMFRADGGYFDWIDQNDNGTFDLGVDAVDLGAGPIVVRSMNAIVSSYHDEAPLFGSEDPAFDPKLDFLYADQNGNEKRDAGKAAGFTEDTPTYGEQLLVMDDVNQNGMLDKGEKLVALKTSKIKSFRLDSKTYRRGTNLIDAPYEASMLHGVGATTVLAGGVPGLTGLAGMAPDAELVMATDTMGGRDYQMASFCVSEGARVVLHEYAPWVGYHLDGSSPTEQLIDSSSAQGVVHVNPAGNLSTSNKLYKRTVAAGSTTPITIDVPSIGITYWASSVLWRDTSRDLTMVLTGPDGTTKTIDTSPLGSQVDWGGGLSLYTDRVDSDRGTARVDIYLAAPQTAVPVPVGTWTLTVTDPAAPGSPDLTLFAYTQDEVSGWGKGAAFPEYVSEDHLVGYPGTADHGMPVSAFTGHSGGDFGSETSGARAYYSGRGHRIDGQAIMWIGGPDNPITAGRFADRDLSYIVYGGTSGASPHVAGSAALILEHDPSLTGDQVKQAIKSGASTDSFTGAVPNDDFGWGKLDVYRAIFGKDRPGGSPPVISAKPFTMPPGTVDAPFLVSDADEPTASLKLEVDRDYDGVYDEVLAGPSVTLSYPDPGDRHVKLRATDSTGKTSSAILTVHVVAPSTEDGPPLTTSGGGGAGNTVAGGGCAVGIGPEPSEGARFWGAMTLLGLVALGRRARGKDRREV